MGRVQASARAAFLADLTMLFLVKDLSNPRPSPDCFLTCLAGQFSMRSHQVTAACRAHANCATTSEAMHATCPTP